MSGKLHKTSDDFKKEFGEFKPCLWGSDAHSLDKLLLPACGRYTWIKADLTFDGLKQVVYDPDSRVLIQEESPQQKRKYQTIDRVRFLDASDNPNFGSEWIQINPDLNTIIGGKSSGKSILLHHIAKSVNYSEVEEKSKISNSPTYDDLYSNSNFDFQVEWSDGEISSLKEPSESKPITHIPQLYVNHLAEKIGIDHLNLLVRDILSQNQIFKNFIDKKEQDISTINQTLINNIEVLFLLIEKHKTITKEINDIGIKKSIANEIISLNDSIINLRAKSGFTDEEERIHKELSRRLKLLKNRREFFVNLQTYGDHIVESSNIKKYSISDTLRRQISAELLLPKKSIFVQNTFEFLENRISKAIKELEVHVQDRLSDVPKHILKIDGQVKTIEQRLTPLEAKFKNQKELKSTQEKLLEEENKIRKIERMGLKRQALIYQKEEILTIIIGDYEKILNLYMEIISELDKPQYKIEQDIDITSKIQFNEDKFNEFFGSFDQRFNIKDLLKGLMNNNGEYCFDHTSHVSVISKIFKDVIDDNIPALRKGVSKKDLIKRLFADCFSVQYLVYYKGDEIVNMSPGKRGLVLLNLLLHLSNSTHPILIDQPEDNLDNRTIYEQLKRFIRNRKSNRQIIMVTHNANLVVAVDSECVIVANQAGQNVGEENSIYRFEYCTGSIENSFEDLTKKSILNQKGIRQHICEILEGGVSAFKEREMKYGLRH